MPFYDKWKDNIIDYLLHKKNILLQSIPSFRYLIVLFMEKMVAFFWWFNGLFMTLPVHYIFLGIIASYLSFYIYVKLRYPFWSSQPVLHTYDWWRRYLCKTPYIIQSSPMKLNKYYSDENVKTISYPKLSSKSLKKIRDFLQAHYIPSDAFLYTITRKHINTIMNGHNRKCYVSTYLFQTSPESDFQIGGCAFSKPIDIQFRLNNGEEVKESANMIDYLCVHRDKKSEKIIRPLFQTHEKNVRIDSGIPISIFKKEVDICEGVIPLVQYNTYTFHIMRRPIEKLPAAVSCSVMSINNIAEFIELVKPMYDFTALSNIGNIIGFIEKQEWWIYCMKQEENILGMYIFKNAHLTSDHGNGRTIELVSSICNIQNSQLFYLGFLHSFKEVLRINPNVKWLVGEDIGHSIHIINGLMREKIQMVSNTPAAFYLYNYIHPNTPISKDKFLFL